MIYVLKSAGYDEDENYVDLLKVGFSEVWSYRYKSYLNHNPTVRLLYSYPEGTRDDESNLHTLFKKYRYEEYGREWYYYSKELLEIFENYSTIENLRTIIPDFEAEKVDDNLSDLDNQILLKTLNKIEGTSGIIKGLRRMNSQNFSNLMTYFRFTFGDDITDLIVDKYEKLSYLSQLESEELVRNIILKTFQVGNRYNLKYIKQTLLSIYEDLEIDENPKATDLNKWFIIKLVKIGDPITKARDNGFKLLELK